jgi:hypothetical protein
MAMRERPDWESELNEEQLELFRRMHEDDPGALIDRLREDTEFLVALARADTRPHLASWFTERRVEGQESGWSYDRERTGPLGPNAAGVEWSWIGVHDDQQGDGAFNTIAASGQEVTVRGVTLVGVEDGRFRVRRYIDWAGLFAQLGLALNWRTPVADAGVREA